MRALSTARWIVVGVLGAAIVVPAWYLVGGGRTVAEIDGGSMVPTFHIGDVVVDVPVAADELVPGMMITVKEPDGQYFTHRILSIDSRGGLHLKGDANAFPDEQVRQPNQIVGRVETVLPRIPGGILIQLQTWPFRVSLFITMLGLALMPIRRLGRRHRHVLVASDLLSPVEGAVLAPLALVPSAAPSGAKY